MFHQLRSLSFHTRNLGWIIYGPSSASFATWNSSFMTMTRAALGEFDSLYPEMTEINPTASYALLFTYQVSERGV